MPKQNKPILGEKNESVSWCTLKTDDLLSVFVPYLLEHKHEKAREINREYRKYLTNNGEIKQKYEEQADMLLQETVFDAMNDLAPEGYYFGSHPGNGSDFGFWELEDEE